MKLEKEVCPPGPTLDNYEQSCFVRSDVLKMKCACKTQMMPPRLTIRNYKQVKGSLTLCMMFYGTSKKEMIKIYSIQTSMTFEPQIAKLECSYYCLH